MSQSVSFFCFILNKNSAVAFTQGFREGRYQVLIATDVAARGLDIPEVDLVIQCSPPKASVFRKHCYY